MNYGWICPKCGKVYSPATMECWNCNKTECTITSTSIAKEDYEKWKETAIYYGKDGNDKRRKVEDDN